MPRIERERKPTPASGWRRALWKATRINLGPSRSDLELAEWLKAIDTPVARHCISVSSLKGGIGKTTATLALGTVFALHRRDAAVGIDANPDRGTLGLRTGMEHALTSRDLLDNLGQIDSSGALRRFTHQAPSRFEVVASDRDVAKARAFSPEDYARIVQVLGTFRQLILTDTGTDLTNSVFEAILQTTDTLVVAASTAQDGAALAWETLSVWERKGRPDLVRNAVVPIVQESEGRQVPVDELKAQFASRVRAVVVIPRDTHLAGGGTFDWELLHPKTRHAYIQLAALVAHDFPRNAPRWSR